MYVCKYVCINKNRHIRSFFKRFLKYFTDLPTPICSFGKNKNSIQPIFSADRISLQSLLKKPEMIVHYLDCIYSGSKPRKRLKHWTF